MGQGTGIRQIERLDQRHRRRLARDRRRDGEPQVYLTSTYRDIPNGAQSEGRNKEWAAWSKKTDAQMDAESGDRAKFRKLRGTMLLQEYTIRK